MTPDDGVGAELDVRTIEGPDGRALEVHEAGDPDGVPVLWHHGTPASAEAYAPWVQDARERGIRLVGYMRPGYSGSSPQPGRRAADAARDARAVLDALGIRRCVTWGISGGGPHALATAALSPDRVAAAAALGSLAPYDADGLDWIAGAGAENVRGYEASLAGRASLEAYLEANAGAVLDATPAELVEAWRTLLGEADRETLSGELASYVAATGRHGLARGLDGWRDDALAFVAPWGFDVAAIEAPVLVLHGGDDRFVPVTHGRWLADRIPGAVDGVDDAAGHLTQIVDGVPRAHAWLLEQL